MILFNPLGVHPWGQLGCQKKQNCTRNSNLSSFCSTFDLELKKRWKTAQNKQKYLKNDNFEIAFLISLKQKVSKFKFFVILLKIALSRARGLE